MTTTDTTSLAEILSAKKADLTVVADNPMVGLPTEEAEEIIRANVVTGEIVPGTAVETSPIAPAVPAPVEPPPDYSFTPAKVLGAIPFADGYWRMARRVCRTDFVPTGFRGNPEAIVAAFMRGYEMGFPPMQALDSFNVIQGKVGLTAEAMRALILNAGHDIILTDGAGCATAECHRKQWPADKWATYTYSLEDARQAGLTGKDSWKKNPRAMLDARATSGAGRRYFADVLAGMSYTPEEIRDFSGPEQEVTSSTTPTAPESPLASTPTIPPSGQKAPGAASSSVAGEPQTPKRPRGRPRKDGTPPKAAAGPSASETPETPQDSTAALQPMDAVGPPELTSLNSPGDASVTRSMLSALTQIIAGLPTAQQPLCRAFIRQHYPEGSAELDQADIQKCIDIAAGWPDSAVQHPIPEDGQQLAAF
jgi:hypothetical protein